MLKAFCWHWLFVCSFKTKLAQVCVLLKRKYTCYYNKIDSFPTVTRSVASLSVLMPTLCAHSPGAVIQFPSREKPCELLQHEEMTLHSILHAVVDHNFWWAQFPDKNSLEQRSPPYTATLGGPPASSDTWLSDLYSVMSSVTYVNFRLHHMVFLFPHINNFKNADKGVWRTQVQHNGMECLEKVY